MLRYLVCEDRAHRAFLRLMVLDDLFNTFIPENPASSFVFQACGKHPSLNKLVSLKHHT